QGNEAFKAGDYPTAIGHYTTAILADGNDPTFYLNRAAAYLKLGKNEDAERDSTKVLALNPSNVKALFRRGQARRPLGNIDGARQASREPTSGNADTTPVRPPMTLFDFTKSWNSLETDEARWKLMCTIPPSSLPALFQASLEPDLLKSILHTFQAVCSPFTSSAVRDYLTALMRVQRFETLMLFMDKREQQ
ncbi:hypothetical protein PISMIDRAFT_57666, partial [Pisolithus microcarpus 441]